jgi:hypothetical protein
MAIPSLATAGTRTFAVGYAGQVADAEPFQIDSFVNTSATAVDFGRVVVRDTTDRSCKVMAADTDQILGISVRNPLAPASTDGNNTVNFPQYASVPVMRDGVVFAVAAENVRRGDQVLAITAGGGTLGGSQGGVAGSGRVDVAGAIWEDTVASGAVGRIRIKTVGTRRTTT